MKCLERDPARRYATAKALAEELERFLEGRPIQARRAGAWEIAWRWCRRKPTEAVLLFALVLMFVTGFASVTWLWRRADAESLRAKRAADAESRLRAEAQAEVAIGELDRGIALARAGEIDQGLLWMADSIRRAPAERPDLLRLARDNLDAWGASTIPIRAILEHQAIINQAVYSPDGSAILTGSNDGTAQFWDATTGRPLRPPIRHGDQVLCVAISRDGRLLATGGADRRARLWEAGSGMPIGPPLFHGEPVKSVAFSPDGRLLATRSRDRVAQVWDLASGRPVGPSSDRGAIRDVRFSPDGRSLATGGEDGVVRFWSTRDLRPEPRELDTGAPLDGIVFGPKPGLIATWQADGTARVWDADSGRAITPPIPNGDAPLFSPDGKLLLNLGPEDHARLWDLATGRPWTRFSATRRRSSVRPSLPTAGSY